LVCFYDRRYCVVYSRTLLIGYGERGNFKRYDS
jgi:hypothetical protein